MQDLTPKQTKAIQALLECNSVIEAASRVKINPATLHRWLKISVFRGAFLEAKREMVSQGLTQIQQRISVAVDTLDGIMQDEENPANSRVSAAKSLIDFSLKSLELEDLSERIKKIEEYIKCQQNRKSKK